MNLSQMRLSELVVEWSDVFDGSRKQRLETKVLDVLKPHSDNLERLEIVSYGGTKFPKWVTDTSFKRLTDVSIEKCRNCKFLAPLGHMPSLKKLSIKSMVDVKEVGSELLGNGPAAFPSLEILIFKNMPQWEVWSVNAVGVAVFPCLKQLYIRNCPKMERWELWSANADVKMFPCLQELFVHNCPNLVKVSLEALPSLRNLNVLKCSHALLTSLVGVASSTTKLSILDISGLSDEVWGGVVQYLGVVEELRISNCNIKRNLWESLEANKKVLVNLKMLEIRNCEKLVRIGGGEKEEKESDLLLLTPLRMLKIRGCNNLKHLSWPDTVETLDIGGCENLEHLSCPTNSIQELKIWSCKSLKHLSCPHSIETLEIGDCMNLEYLSCLANSIQELKIWDCSSITSVSFQTEGGGWQKIKSLDITRCNSVLEKELEKQVLTIISNNINSPPKLEFLYIDGWENLKSITKFTCFIQLTTLVIEDCGRIESVPDLQNLTLLKHMNIRNCKSMDGPPPLKRSSHGGGVSGVWPPKLDSLKIGELKRPISEWGPLPTSLVELTLFGGSLAEEEDDVKSFPTSLLPYSLSSSLTSLVLDDFKKLERISSEGLQHLTSLRYLSIKWCPKLKDLPEMLLPSLLSLEIYNCQNEELKEKMMSKRGSYSPLLSHIPQVHIKNCRWT